MKKNWMWGLSLLLIGSMASCKPSQSAYKAAYEQAQVKTEEVPPVVEVPSTEVVVDTVQTPPVEAQPIERNERINAVDGNDELIKTFNVIVGSFIQRANAESLCERLKADGYPAVLAQNAEGMYRVVACSFGDRDSAIEARVALQYKYPNQFTDTWFLINE